MLHQFADAADDAPGCRAANHSATLRTPWIRGFTLGLPIVWGAAYLFLQSPVLMVQIGGVMTGVFLLGTVVAGWYLRKTETDPRIYGSGLFDAALVVSSIAIILLGIYGALNVFGAFK
ncbi:hypothetical protein [Geminicoccus flavidas]|uniref:hypothetical protein n=1 Tax=Geminicoccus flavidas TaxID=2506407 RepID=UPI001F2BC0A9|nr:hypothetical protein [Geminicoccus flavidas]